MGSAIAARFRASWLSVKPYVRRLPRVPAEGEQAAAEAADAGAVEVLNARLAAAEAAVAGGDRQRSYLQAEKVRRAASPSSLALSCVTASSRS